MCRNLQTLDLSNNSLTILPNEIGSLTQLTELVLTNNQITVLPESIGNTKIPFYNYKRGTERIEDT